MHSYLHNIKTFNNATRHLTRVERSLYRDAIELYYDTEQPLPANDFDGLARRLIACTDEEKAALKYVLGEFFELTGDVYSHTFCDIEIDKFQNQGTAKSKAGKASAEARRKKSAELKRLRKESSKQNSEQNPTPVEHTNNNRSSVVHNHEPLTMNHEPLTMNHEVKKNMSGKPDDAVKTIFDYWCSVMNKNASAKLTPKRKSCVAARLSDGYSIETIKQAIDNCARSPHHMGQNDGGTVYDDLTLICRSGEKLEWFVHNVKKFNPSSQSKSERDEQHQREMAEWLAGDEKQIQGEVLHG